MANASKIWNYIKSHPYPVLLLIFTLWTALGVFPLVSYENDSNVVILGCEYAYTHGIVFPPVYSFSYPMQPLTVVMVVAVKYVLPFLSCMQIYCLTTAIAGFLFLTGSIEFARRITGATRFKALVAAILLPEMYAIAMYPNSAIFAAACFVWALVAINRNRYVLAALLMCAAPLFRADVFIVFPAIFPLFIFLGKGLKKSILLSAIFAVAVVCISLVLFWLMGASPFEMSGTYDRWNNMISLGTKLKAIYGFYSLSYFILLPIGIWRICRMRHWKELFLILLPVVLLHCFYSGMGCAAKHFLYLAPFVIIAGIRALDWLCDVMSRRRAVKYTVIICAVCYYTLSFRFSLPGKTYMKTGAIYTNGLVLPICSANIAGFDMSLGVGAGQHVNTADEDAVLSGQLFYSWHIHLNKLDWVRFYNDLEQFVGNMNSGTVIGGTWAVSNPLISYFIEQGREVDYNETSKCFSIKSEGKNLTVRDDEFPLGDTEPCDYVLSLKNKSDEGTFLIISPFYSKETSMFETLAESGQLVKVVSGLYRL